MNVGLRYDFAVVLGVVVVAAVVVVLFVVAVVAVAVVDDVDDGDLSEADCDQIERNRYYPVGKH